VGAPLPCKNSYVTRRYLCSHGDLLRRRTGRTLHAFQESIFTVVGALLHLVSSVSAQTIVGIQFWIAMDSKLVSSLSFLFFILLRPLSLSSCLRFPFPPSEPTQTLLVVSRPSDSTSFIADSSALTSLADSRYVSLALTRARGYEAALSFRWSPLRETPCTTRSRSTSGATSSGRRPRQAGTRREAALRRPVRNAPRACFLPNQFCVWVERGAFRARRCNGAVAGVARGE
jgi:hypothetical protein